MKPTRDPEGAELVHLLLACNLHGKVVLEIGCGDGVFSRQYANTTHRLVGIDPLGSEVSVAAHKSRSNRSHFLPAKGEQLPFPAQSFDIAIFASSL